MKEYFILPVFLLIAVYWDIRFKKLPNWMTGIGFLAGMLWALFEKNFVGYITGSLIGIAAVLPFILVHGIGGGDVKLLGVLAGWLGIQKYSVCAVSAFLGAALFGLVEMLIKGQLKQRMKTAVFYLKGLMKGKKENGYVDQYQGRTVCFSVFILLGYCFMILYFHSK